MKEDTAAAAKYLSGLINGYTDGIRVSDGKANIAVLFVAFMMGPILASYEKFPRFLPLPVALTPFLVVYFCLLVCLVPRYPKSGKNNFVIQRNARPQDFVYVDDPIADLEQLRLRCAILSQILYWKTLFLRISFMVSLVSVVAVLILLYMFGFK
jgi:hypothetical protein